ncbi:MAG TPA: hypothetical protein VHC41_08570 [Mycobacteriales bacterium]|jgi:hypothetical protein|nr:hypothetical protein [Mycobacteriales bacterium]
MEHYDGVLEPSHGDDPAAMPLTPLDPRREPDLGPRPRARPVRPTAMLVVAALCLACAAILATAGMWALLVVAIATGAGFGALGIAARRHQRRNR